MTPKSECSRQRRAVLVLATIWPSGCATGAFDVASLGGCPPVVEYSRGSQAQAS